MMADRAMFAATPDCRESRSMHYSSLYCTQYSILHISFNENTENIFLHLVDMGHI